MRKTAHLQGKDPNLMILTAEWVTKDVPGVPARHHRKKRTAKKWLKRYGYRQVPSDEIYVLGDDCVIMHPQSYQYIRELVGDDKVAETILNYLKEKKDGTDSESE